MVKSLKSFPFPTLVTERLVLRQLKEEDAALLYELRTQPENNVYLDLPYPSTIDDSIAHVCRINQGIVENKHIYWLIELKDGTSVGTICLWHFDEKRNSAELGYELKLTAQRKGYMTEALSMVMRFARETLSLTILEAYTHIENNPSVRLLKKQDFILEGTQAEKHSRTGEEYKHGIFRYKIRYQDIKKYHERSV